MVCVVFTWLLIFYAEFVVLRVILLPDIASFYSVVNLIIFEAFAGSCREVSDQHYTDFTVHCIGTLRDSARAIRK